MLCYVGEIFAISQLFRIVAMSRFVFHLLAMSFPCEEASMAEVPISLSYASQQSQTIK